MRLLHGKIRLQEDCTSRSRKVPEQNLTLLMRSSIISLSTMSYPIVPYQAVKTIVVQNFGEKER